MAVSWRWATTILWSAKAASSPGSSFRPKPEAATIMHQPLKEARKNECRMPRHECRRNVESRMTNSRFVLFGYIRVCLTTNDDARTTTGCFVLWHSCFLRHSSLGIRHYQLTGRQLSCAEKSFAPRPKGAAKPTTT